MKVKLLCIQKKSYPEKNYFKIVNKNKMIRKINRRIKKLEFWKVFREKIN
jgi:hypothetical protein